MLASLTLLLAASSASALIVHLARGGALSGQYNDRLEKKPQTVTFTSSAPTNATVGGSYTATATTSSGLTVTLSINPSSASVCTISGETVSFLGPGRCSIDANQAGNRDYEAAQAKQQSFTVASAAGSSSSS